jgi:hypothetical protein
MPRSVASDLRAWDRWGEEFTLIGSSCEIEKVAREIKRGASVGLVRVWGIDGSIDWIDSGLDEVRGSSRNSFRWLREQGLENVDLSLWRRETDGTMLVLGWVECEPMSPHTDAQ